MHSFRILAGTAAVLLLSRAAFTQDLTFSRHDFESYAGARAVVADDFDRNGWPDLALANAGRNTVTILLNDGGGEMRPAFDAAAGAGPFALTSGDFNRDGIPDLAVANADANSISVLTGRGDGTFTRTDMSTSPYLSPRGITTADVNLDGKADLVYTGYGTNVAQILMGRGDGGFSKGTAFFVGDVEQPEGVGTADFNHDGRLDLAIAHGGPGGLSVVYSMADTTILVEHLFLADPTLTYKLWLRLKADGNHWPNDSVWVQFSGATDLTGRPAYRIGTTSGLAVNLEECAGCGVSGWGWEDDGWGAVDRVGVQLRFPEGGWQRIVIQTREHGASVDQIVLSADTYVTRRPGAAKNDTTILPRTQ